MPKDKIKSFPITTTNALEATLDWFDGPFERSWPDVENKSENLWSGIIEGDDDDIDIEDADLGDQDDETGEIENDADEEFDAERTVPRQADIEFRIKGNKIIYQINLGNLVSHKNKAVVNARLEAMTSMAEFLKEYQEKFLRSPDKDTAYENLRSCKKKKFLKYHNIKNTGNRKDSGWSTKAIHNKYIKVPFTRKLIPAYHFFDLIWGKVMILKKSIDVHLSCKKSFPLSASDQSKILSCFLDEDYSERNISETFWPKLRSYYNKTDWETVRLVGGKASKVDHDEIYLQKIAENVSQIMRKPIKRRGVFGAQKSESGPT